MKALLALIVVATLIAGCSKRDVIKWIDRTSRCDLADQSNTYNDGKTVITRKLFNNKTYYPNGLPKTLNIVFTGYFGDADTLQYSFEYSVNAALVHVKSTTRDGTKTNYDLSATFDSRTGFATKIGNDVIMYEGKKMKSYGPHQFVYDERGNLTEFLRSGEVKAKFTYDQTKTGGQQEFYTRMDFDGLGSTFSTAEVLGWIPTGASPNRRMSKELLSGDYVLTGESYSDHQYKAGKLVEFKILSRGGIRSNVVKNTWKCN